MSQVVRVDLARNCLNSYLWEIILYVEEGGKTLPYTHGWFDFPHELYAQLFETKNNLKYSKYKTPLEHWVDPETKFIDLSLLRTVTDTLDISFRDASDMMYPVAGARKKKYKEIIYPKSFNSMRDLQTDSTVLATFSSPGFYDTKDPRSTELGRIYKLLGIKLYSVKIKDNYQTLYEIQCEFSHRTKKENTTLVIGGLDFNNFPVLTEDKANNGWKNSMGIGNHPFYETYKENLADKAETSPYYAMLLDEKGRWLDSHKIGIDGPIFHFSDADKTKLNLWLLSFERHALVGHYDIELK